MAITRVGSSAGNFGSATSLALSRTAGATGNLIVIGWLHAVPNTNAPSISDTQGNTWNVCNTGLKDDVFEARIASWYCYAKNTSATTITVATNSGSCLCGMTLDEFTGNDTANAFDQHAEDPTGQTDANPTSPAITLGADDCLVWSMCAAYSGLSSGNIDGSAATLGGTASAGQMYSEFRILSGRSGAAVTAAWVKAASIVYDVVVASFKPASAPATTAIPVFMNQYRQRWG